MTFNLYITLYLSGAGLYCAFLLFNKLTEQENLKATLRSWLLIFMASIFWVIAIPISLIEIIIKGKTKPYGRGKSGIAQETPNTQEDPNNKTDL